MEELEKLWTDAGFKELKIDTIRRTDFGGKDMISYFIIQAEK
ncbi:hypothetical protein [Tissierella praeacuta]